MGLDWRDGNNVIDCLIDSPVSNVAATGILTMRCWRVAEYPRLWIVGGYSRAVIVQNHGRPCGACTERNIRPIQRRSSSNTAKSFGPYSMTPRRFLFEMFENERCHLNRR